MDSIQNVVLNAQQIVDNIGKQPHRSSSKEAQAANGRPEYDFRQQNAHLRNSYVHTQVLGAQKGYQSDFLMEQSTVSGGPSGHPESSSVDGLTNLDRYKQKMKSQRAGDPPQQQPPAPPLAYQPSVRDTVSKLQEQSRLNGGGYGTNQFSSLDGRTASDQRPGGQDQELQR